MTSLFKSKPTISTTTTRAYHINKHTGIDQLKLSNNDTLPALERGQVLLKIHAVSLNHRDLMVVAGTYPPPMADNLIPCSDGAGEIAAIGDGVSRVVVGDRVIGLFDQNWIGGDITNHDRTLGGNTQGVLSEYIILNETGVSKIGNTLSYEEASTIPCAGVTAWNALYCGMKSLRPGQSVLLLGTGGVSIFALQFALISGAIVILTSSSDDKLNKAKQLGVHHAINYKKTPHWEEEVMKLTNGKGVDHVVEVGGPGTLKRSILSTKFSGQVHLIGFLDKQKLDDVVGLIVLRAVILRGLLIGSREMAENTIEAINSNKIKPVIDKVFSFEQAKEAYEYLKSGSHFGKVVIKVQ